MNPRKPTVSSLIWSSLVANFANYTFGKSAKTITKLTQEAKLALRPLRELQFRPAFRTARDQRRAAKSARNNNPWKGVPL